MSYEGMKCRMRSMLQDNCVESVYSQCMRVSTLNVVH